MYRCIVIKQNGTFNFFDFFSLERAKFFMIIAKVGLEPNSYQKIYIVDKNGKEIKYGEI